MLAARQDGRVGDRYKLNQKLSLCLIRFINDPLNLFRMVTLAYSDWFIRKTYPRSTTPTQPTCLRASIKTRAQPFCLFLLFRAPTKANL